MTNPIIDKYAHLLLHYCVSIQPGDRVLIRSGFLAEPLLQSLYRQALEAGAIPELMVELNHQEYVWGQYAISQNQWDYIPMQYRAAMESFEAYLLIKAPANTRHAYTVSSEVSRQRQLAWQPYQQLYFERTAAYDLKRNFCVFPTSAGAQEAGMHTEMYEKFVFDACLLGEDNPKEAWLEVKRRQQSWVDFLNKRERIRYVSDQMDITFSTAGRTWINSYGTTNMPSGEIYTSPVEDQVNGRIYFDYPLLYQGKELQGVAFGVEDGLITTWSAEKGEEVLDEIMQVPGARRFGEAAIGTNNRIKQFTRNILFDEKIGGTIHMAIGQSYLQAGGKNKCSLHLDLIADMTRNGQIYADDELIYEKGKFLIA